jgi:hypothetical protein
MYACLVRSDPRPSLRNMLLVSVRPVHHFMSVTLLSCIVMCQSRIHIVIDDVVHVTVCSSHPTCGNVNFCSSVIMYVVPFISSLFVFDEIHL